MLFWNWSDCSHRNKQTGERGRRNKEFTRTSGPQVLICPAYNFLHPLKKEKTFHSFREKSWETKSPFYPVELYFFSGEKKKTNPQTHKFYDLARGLGGNLTLTKQSGGSKQGWKGNPRWKQKHTVPQGTKALRRIFPTKTDTIRFCLLFKCFIFSQLFCNSPLKLFICTTLCYISFQEWQTLLKLSSTYFIAADK